MVVGRQVRFKPAVEALEERWLLYGVTYEGIVAEISDTQVRISRQISAAAKPLNIGMFPDAGNMTINGRSFDIPRRLVFVNIKGSDGRDNIRVYWSNASNDPPATLPRIVVSGRGGNDRIRVSGPFPGEAILRGGPGDDFLRGGLQDDRIVGGPGKDTLKGGGGNDHLIDEPDSTLPVHLNTFNGRYQGTYSGSVTAPPPQGTESFSGSVKFRITNGKINVTVPGVGNGTLNANGAINFSASDGDGGRVYIRGTATRKRSGAVVIRGTWNSVNGNEVGSGSWDARRL